MRTCVGCRQRATAADLLRVVVGPGAGDGAAAPVAVVPDPRRRIPGRGAWLHPDPGCADLAERRRAYGRALRVPGPVDPAPVNEYLAALTGSTTRNVTARRNPAGEPDGRSMKRQR